MLPSRPTALGLAALSFGLAAAAIAPAPAYATCAIEPPKCAVWNPPRTDVCNLLYGLGRCHIEADGDVECTSPNGETYCSDNSINEKCNVTIGSAECPLDPYSGGCAVWEPQPPCTYPVPSGPTDSSITLPGRPVGGGDGGGGSSDDGGGEPWCPPGQTCAPPQACNPTPVKVLCDVAEPSFTVQCTNVAAVAPNCETYTCIATVNGHRKTVYVTGGVLKDDVCSRFQP